MIVRHTPLVLACALSLAGCPKEKKTDPQPQAKQAAAKPAPAKPAAAKPAPATPAAARPAEPKLPTAAEFQALIDKATRIEAKSGKLEKRVWSKDLTKADIANLKAGLGEAKFDRGAPRCLPTVDVILYQDKKELAKLGAFCDAKKASALMRWDLGKAVGSVEAQHPAKIKAALESPVDK